MKNHVLRPLWVALVLVALILIARVFLVPKDFGVNGRNFTFGYFRLSSIDEWRAVKVKYKGKEYCAGCHEEQVTKNLKSKHQPIECENCHGPVVDHPDTPEKLPIDLSRELCLRCHAVLPYPSSLRMTLKGIDPDSHNTGTACAKCHNPHNPNLEDMQ